MKTQDSRRHERARELLRELDPDVQQFMQKLLKIEGEHRFEDPPPHSEIRSACVKLLKELVR
jgi:hypothetical protein